MEVPFVDLSRESELLMKDLIKSVMKLRTEKTEDVYASFDAETVDKLIQFIKIQNEIEKENDDD